MTGAFRLGRRTIGGGAPCFVIAEAGVNHNGEAALAHRLVDAAAEGGADAVKFQTFRPESLAAAGAPLARYQEQSVAAADQQRMLERLALSDDAHRELAAHARERGLVFLSSPFDERSADWHTLRDAFSLAMDYPPLARRLVPLLVPFLDPESLPSTAPPAVPRRPSFPLRLSGVASCYDEVCRPTVGKRSGARSKPMRCASSRR